ncbi:MAG TPA: serine hydrolase [Gemmatimonadaceae bacterium]
MKRFAAAILVAASAAGAQTPDLGALDRYVAQAVRDWHVTGLAIAVVKGDSLVFAKGYGVRDLRKTDRIDEHTRFAVGSTTKAMTSAALGMLVDEGKLKWDDRVIDIIPEFRLADPYATREATIRDLLTHRTGLPGTDLMWAREPLTPAEMTRRLRFVQPSSSFRSNFEYQNVVYAIGGLIIERVSGMPWEKFVQTRIFAPLGMNESEPLVAGIDRKPNVATPHAPVGDSSRVTSIRTTDPVASAGSVWSSVSDMSKWMRFILDSGRVGSKRLLSPATFTEIVTPQMRAPLETYPALSLAKPHGFSYGLGWFIQDYQGQVVWMHTGSINGMSAIIGLLPDKRVGVYVLANLDHAELRHALMYKVFDLYAGNPTRDWSAELNALFHPSRPATTAQQAQASAPPSLPLERYAGTYADSAYGVVQVDHANGALRVRFRGAELGTLEAARFESFRVRTTSGEDQAILTFVPDGVGGIASVRAFGVTFGRARSR